MTAELERLDVPPALVAEHSASIARYRDSTALPRQMVEKYRAGDLPAAAVIDQAIVPMSAAVQDFERKYNLVDCL
jgi:hypothetical protein